jgi:hypothetical protein
MPQRLWICAMPPNLNVYHTHARKLLDASIEEPAQKKSSVLIYSFLLIISAMFSLSVLLMRFHYRFEW